MDWTQYAAVRMNSPLEEFEVIDNAARHESTSSLDFRAIRMHSRSFVLLVGTFLFSQALTAGALSLELPVDARVKNVDGYCTWACLDTLARANGIVPLRGVFKDRRERSQDAPADPGYDDEIEWELTCRGVRFEMRPQWSYERDLLEQYAQCYGVAVSLMAGNPWSVGCHTIVVTRYDEEWVEFYDSSKPLDKDKRPKIWRCGRGWFDQWWLGSSVVVFPEKQRHAAGG